MAEGQEDVTKDDFVAWAERYIQCPGKEQLSGLDLYAARCGLLHQYGIVSRLSREGKCRQLGYGDKMEPPVRFNPTITKDVVIVSVHALAEAFFQGSDRFVVDVFKDPKRAEVESLLPCWSRSAVAWTQGRLKVEVRKSFTALMAAWWACGW